MMGEAGKKPANLRAGRIGITRKLFYVTAGMFIIFISILLLTQFLFLGKFYSASKEKRSVQALEDFCRDYVQNAWGKSVLDTEAAYMADSYGLQLAILNDYGNNKYGGIEMAVRNAQGKEVSVDLHDVSLVDSLLAGGMQVGKNVSIKGFFSDRGFRLRPFKIEVEGMVWERNDGDESTEGRIAADWSHMVQVAGTVEYLRLMNENEYENAASPFTVLKAALKQWQEANVRIPDRRCIEDYKDRATGNNYKLFIFPLTRQEGSREAVFAIVPLQPVDEAVEVIKSYLVYIFLAALVFVLILSYIYSRIVTQPLIEINTAALKMSQMDFQAKCGIHSRDELGDLSQSLNTMSSRLGSTLAELKEFVSNASHELKTPIAAMGGYLEALKDDIRKDKRERYLERLQFEVGRMNSLVRDMLELSRMETGPEVLRKERFDLGSLLGEILEESEGPVKEKHLSTTVKAGPEPVFVFADRIKLGQVMGNYVTNAIRHTPYGGEIRIEIRTTTDETAFSIENQGEPIPKEKLGRIWERFYRIESSRARNSGGTGLGLAISAKILQLHNAFYGARNTEKGVLFYFILTNP